MEYGYRDAQPTHDAGYLLTPLKALIAGRQWQSRRAFDLGCGNGTTGNMLHGLGFDVTQVDTSESGIGAAQKAFPYIKSEIGSVYDDLAAEYGTFDLVVSLEVLEHCMEPRAVVRTFLSLIAPGGIGVLSTPYHGYIKNLALAVTGKMDAHFTALWDGGHIKFFSIKTLGEILRDEGAADFRIIRAGRIPPLAKSMIAIVEEKGPRQTG